MKSAANAIPAARRLASSMHCCRAGQTHSHVQTAWRAWVAFPNPASRFPPFARPPLPPPASSLSATPSRRSSCTASMPPPPATAGRPAIPFSGGLSLPHLSAASYSRHSGSIAEPVLGPGPRTSLAAYFRTHFPLGPSPCCKVEQKEVSNPGLLRQCDFTFPFFSKWVEREIARERERERRKGFIVPTCHPVRVSLLSKSFRRVAPPAKDCFAAANADATKTSQRLLAEIHSGV